jgi:hypothetical protein
VFNISTTVVEEIHIFLHQQAVSVPCINLLNSREHFITILEYMTIQQLLQMLGLRQLQGLRGMTFSQEVNNTSMTSSRER